MNVHFTIKNYVLNILIIEHFMKRKFNLTLILVIILCWHAHAQQTKEKMPDKENYYWLHLPPGYDENSDETYPFILFLHGCGAVAFSNNCGTSTYEADPWDELDKVIKAGIPKEIDGGSDMCFTVNGEEQCFIVISPQLDGTGWNRNLVQQWFQFAMETYNIDHKKVYLTGLSLGGIGTYGFALSNSGDFYFNDSLAAVAPIAGKGNRDYACNIIEKNLPLWAFHGDKDKVVSFRADEGLINDINACDPAPDPAPIFTVYEGYAHSGYVWNTVYNTTNKYYEPNLYEWLLTNEYGNSSNIIPNRKPFVDLGKDSTISASSLTIIGTAVDYDGSISSYEWEQRSGPVDATLDGVSQESLNVSGLSQEGIYKFRLTVTDNRNGVTFDEIRITVKEGGSAEPGNWLELTINDTAGKAVQLFYNSERSNQEQEDVKNSGNTDLQFALKQVSGVVDFNEIKINLIVSFQTRTLFIGDYVSNVGSDWVIVNIPLDDFNHDADKWQNGGVSTVVFKATSGSGDGVFGVDEIRFVGGNQDFVWYGDDYSTSGEASSVIDEPNLFYVSNRHAEGGYNSMSSVSSYNLLNEENEEVKLSDGDIILVYSSYGNKLKEFTYEGASKDVKSLREYVNKEGLFIYKVLKSDGTAHTVKIMQK